MLNEVQITHIHYENLDILADIPLSLKAEDLFHKKMRRHRVLVVRIGNARYLTDVGIRSESPRTPLKLVCDELQTDNICQYRFQKDSFYGWVLCQKERGKA